jgi:hypothetical protein
MTTPVTDDPARGRGYVWAGIAACLLGPILVVAQIIGMKYLFTPWYSPILGTLGAALLLVGLVRRWSILRLIALVLVAAFAGLQWFFLGVMLKLPEYDGPARPGDELPSFASTYADGRPFTAADLRDGTRRAIVFFRGRW